MFNKIRESFSTSKKSHVSIGYLVYFCAFLISFIRAAFLFSEHSGGGFIGLINGVAGATALEGVFLWTYTGLLSRSYKNNIHRNWLMIGTFVSVAMSIVVQVSEYWNKTPDMAWTVLGFAAPLSATFAMVLIIIIEFVSILYDNDKQSGDIVESEVVQRKTIKRKRTVTEELEMPMSNVSDPIVGSSDRVDLSAMPMLKKETPDEKISRLFSGGISKSDIANELIRDGVKRSTAYAKIAKYERG